MNGAHHNMRRSLTDLYFRTRRRLQYRYWRVLEKTQYFSEDRLLEIQAQRLRAILSFVYEHNSFYRERFDRSGIGPESIKSPADISKLPLLTKKDVRRHKDQMISRGYDVRTLCKAKTGGSTGKALELYFTEACSEMRNAVARRHDRWTGWAPGEPIGACWGNPHLPTALKEKVKQWLVQPIIYLDTMLVDDASVMGFVQQWRRVEPTLLYGHAHSLFVLAEHLQANGVDDVRPRGILSTSMMLLPHERRLIEKVFQAKVIDRYGCEEVSLIGCECEKHEGMHLNSEHLVVEFLREDGRQAANGEAGRIVVTDLMNRAMPLIRYEVEDVGVPTDRKCSCGRGLPLFENVTGRVADFLVRRDGSKVAGVSLIENTLTRIPGIDQMQIIQEDYDYFKIQVVSDVELSYYRAPLVSYFKGVFGSAAVIDVIPTSGMSAETNGKYRFSINKVGR